jgi:hypothetical protein
MTCLYVYIHKCMYMDPIPEPKWRPVAAIDGKVCIQIYIYIYIYIYVYIHIYMNTYNMGDV